MAFDQRGQQQRGKPAKDEPDQDAARQNADLDHVGLENRRPVRAQRAQCGDGFGLLRQIGADRSRNADAANRQTRQTDQNRKALSRATNSAIPGAPLRASVQRIPVPSNALFRGLG